MANVDVTRIASNIGALNALNSLQTINQKLALHQTRLSTGKRINSAADDPAGLTIATKMLARSEGMKVANDNIGDALNMLSVAESGLSKMNDILVIMRGKAEQAASDTLGASERDAIATQLSAYAAQIDSMVAETKWNGSQLLDGTVDKRFQTGVDDGEYTKFTLATKFDPGTLGISTVQSGNAAALVATGSVGNLTASPDATVNPFTGLVSLTTGAYKVDTIDFAASTTKGKATALTNPTAWTVAATSANGAEINNGITNLTISGVSAADDSVTFTLSGETTSVVTVDYTAGFDITDLGVLALNTTGLQLSLGVGVTTADDLDAAFAGKTGTVISVDYIKENNVKYQLKNGSNEALALDSDGLSATGATSSTGYAVAGTARDTGRGLKLTFDAITNLQTGIDNFTYKRDNAYSVDVSSATIASTYMGKVNTAMDTVNSALANLGSLMARLTFKAEQTAFAQVNIEGAYSRIMNANMAEEQMNASKYTILQQTAVAMLAQANQAPQSLLTLFR